MQLVIPEGTEVIKKQECDHKDITSVVFPESLTVIEEWAFAVNKITNLTLPKRLKTIGSSAFSHNEITEIRIGKLVEFGAKPFGYNHGCAAGIYRYAGKWSYEEEKSQDE
jgi:hypothetical protein